MGLSSGQVWDLAIFILCIFMFLLYHVWYFGLRGTSFLPLGVEHINLWTTSVRTRSLWSEIMMSNSKEGINAVHTIRNMIISVSLLAAAEATLISQLLNILTDPARLEQIQKFNLSDPISGGESLLSPAVRVALALAALFLSLLTFSQNVRISVHLGFLIRIVPSHRNLHLPLMDETIVLMQRTSLYFTLGLRLMYSFVPLVFYMALGATALLISTCLLMLALFFLDTVPKRHMKRLLRARTQAESSFNTSDREPSMVGEAAGAESGAEGERKTPGTVTGGNSTPKQPQSWVPGPGAESGSHIWEAPV